MNTKKEPVKLRRKQLANGNTSLYLDIYSEGIRRYEFLKLYLVPEKCKADRMNNATTMKLAETIKAARIVELECGRFGMGSMRGGSFWAYLEEYRKEKSRNVKHISCLNTLDSMTRHLERYTKGRALKLENITPAFGEGFKRYLDTTKSAIGGKLSENSKANYYSQFCAVVNSAARKGLIQSNPLASTKKYSRERARAVFLTMDEIRKLSCTPCKHKPLRDTFLFSCLTGLRVSDIMRLRWGQVSEMEGYTRLNFEQFKTGGRMYLDISPSAAALMGERRGGEELVFPDFKYECVTGRYLREWAAQAGIHKHLTFHSGRHTFAVMMLTLGTDIYVVSKLLGHADIKTTQIYADVLDKTRREAVDRIPDLLVDVD